MITLKGAIEIFAMASLCCKLSLVSNTNAQVARVQSCAHHVQCVPPGMTGQLSYYALHSLHHILFSFILLAELLTKDGGEETRVLGENPLQWALENATY